MPEDRFEPMEEAVAAMWTDVLGVTPASTDDDFFDLGGQSLNLMRFLQEVWQRYGVELDVAELFAEPVTVAATARAIDRAMRTSASR